MLKCKHLWVTGQLTPIPEEFLCSDTKNLGSQAWSGGLLRTTQEGAPHRSEK